jgi:hypothetical protein
MPTPGEPNEVGLRLKYGEIIASLYIRARAAPYGISLILSGLLLILLAPKMDLKEEMREALEVIGMIAIGLGVVVLAVEGFRRPRLPGGDH